MVVVRCVRWQLEWKTKGKQKEIMPHLGLTSQVSSLPDIKVNMDLKFFPVSNFYS